MSTEKKLYELKMDVLQSEIPPSLRRKLADQIHEIELLVNTDKTELNLHSVIDCTNLEPDFIKALNELVDTQRQPTKRRF